MHACFLLLLAGVMKPTPYTPVRSCLDEQKGQHTAIFAMANAMYRGAAVADDARLVLSSAEAMSLMVRNRYEATKWQHRFDTSI